MTEDCCFCRKMQREAPKLYRRLKRVAANPNQTRDLFLIQTGYRLGKEQFEKLGPRNWAHSTAGAIW
jgi:hypothetical protein